MGPAFERLAFRRPTAEVHDFPPMLSRLRSVQRGGRHAQNTTRGDDAEIGREFTQNSLKHRTTLSMCG